MRTLKSVFIMSWNILYSSKCIFNLVLADIYKLKISLNILIVLQYKWLQHKSISQSMIIIIYPPMILLI